MIWLASELQLDVIEKFKTYESDVKIDSIVLSMALLKVGLMQFRFATAMNGERR